ncbi:hypothetical protein QJS66_07965 [Kocuria rhizophila]|nr:hypothetical protein QJS66_07965 [Kocuria rhizophila]
MPVSARPRNPLPQDASTRRTPAPAPAAAYPGRSPGPRPAGAAGCAPVVGVRTRGGDNGSADATEGG